jgi:hypothetical protein
MADDSKRLSARSSRSVRLLGVWGIALVCAACPNPASDPGDGTARKIGFDLTSLDEAGLYGPPDGLRSLSYEFCIPAGQGFTAEVRSVDPTAQVYARAKGRIGCRAGQRLVIGQTHQAHYREVLQELAGLPYVERIEQAFFE